MADGRVLIDVKVNGKEAENLGHTLQNIEKKGSGTAGSIKNLGVAMLAFRGVEKIFQAIADSMGQAISRFDTLNRFPKMLELMGVEASVADRATRRLVRGIEGLPTRLDEVTATAQSMFNKMGDMDEATDLTLALNNAFLASGSSSAEASRGLTQFTQMLSAGKVDMQSWKTLQETMNYGLQQVAESFGYAGASAQQDFYKAIQDGEISMRDFSLRLIELDDGVGGFAEIALENSKGIATSWQNIQTAVVNGVAGIISKFNEMSERFTGKTIAENLDGLKVVIREFFSFIQTGIGVVEPLLAVLYLAFKLIVAVAIELAPVLQTLLAVFLAYKAITVVSGMLDTLYLSYLYLQEGALMTVPAIAKLKAALTALGGVKVLAIGLIAGALVYLNNKFAGLSKESQALVESSKKTGKRLQELADDFDAMSNSSANSLRSISNTAGEMKKLAKETDALSKKQNRSTEETKQLKANIEELNNYLGDGVITYNQQKDAIDQSAEAMDNYIEIAHGQEYLNELDAEKIKLQEIQLQLADEIQSSQEEIWRLEEEQHGKNKQQKEELQVAIDEQIEKQELAAESYIESVARMNQIDDQRQGITEDKAAREEALAQEQRERIESGKIALEDLSEYERSLVEEAKTRYQSIAESNQNMWSKIEEDSSISLAQMKENLIHNQEVMKNWADNLQILADRGINQGFLDQMRNAGPEYAGLVEEMVNADDAQLQELVSLWEKGGEDAPGLFKSAFDLNSDVIPEGVENLITDTEQTFSDKMKGIDWNQYGGAVTDGVAQGIEDGSPDVRKAMDKVADDDVEKAFKNKLEIHSPSQVMDRLGKFLMDGLANGIDGASGKVMQALTSVSREMISLTESTRTQINSINSKLTSDMYKSGLNSGIGFRNGLASQRWSIISTAQGIANSVSSTIRSALAIRSPSKKLFKLGSDTGEGFDLGLESWVDKIHDTANRMVDFSLPTYDASDAFSLSKNGRNATVETISTINNNTTTNSPITVQFGDVTWNNKDDIRQTMEEIGFITEQENWRLAT